MEQQENHDLVGQLAALDAPGLTPRFYDSLRVRLTATDEGRVPRAPRARTFIAVCALAVAATAGVAVATDSVTSEKTISPKPPTLTPLSTLSAFARPQTAEEAAADADPALAGEIEALTTSPSDVPESFKAGSPNDDLRFLLKNAGTGGRSIYAFTTDRGKVCLGLTGFTAGCLVGLPEGVNVTTHTGDPDATGTGEGVIVWGYATSNVEAVHAVVDGQAIAAKLGANAYFFEAAPYASVTAINELRVTLKSGGVQHVDPMTS